MAQLAIKSHVTRGKEVIDTLKMLGGQDVGYIGSGVKYYYYIDEYNNILGVNELSNSQPFITYTLEEFLEKYPYKVGDKVNYVKYNDGYPSVYTIQRMRWTGRTVEYLLDSNGFSALAKDLQPYKEEIVDTGCCSMTTKPPMYKLNIEKQKDTNKVIFDTNSQCCDISNKIIEKETMEKEISGAIVDRFICLEGYDFYDDKGNIIDTKEITMKKKQPKYPKTYEECCDVLGIDEDLWFVYEDIDGNHINPACISNYRMRRLDLYHNLEKLIICRDAYWKIAGDWRPNFNDETTKFVITNYRGDVYTSMINNYNRILSFPTKEMRDVFYENFKKLIEECKELL